MQFIIQITAIAALLQLIAAAPVAINENTAVEARGIVSGLVTSVVCPECKVAKIGAEVVEHEWKKHHKTG
jgi:hypothetical protein